MTNAPVSDSPNQYRMLDEPELPMAGDEAQFLGETVWRHISIPSMWMAGGQRICGVQFRRRSAMPDAPLSDSQRNQT